VTDRIATGPVDHWIDADTVVMAWMDLGWGIRMWNDPRRQTTHVRLSGYNAPDTRVNAKWYNPALKQSGLAYVNSRWEAGTMLRLLSHGLDDFGRSLADIYQLNDGTDIGAALCELSFVRTGDYPVAPLDT
jgi:endonuclease YncB( thermonuclease family)